MHSSKWRAARVALYLLIFGVTIEASARTDDWLRWDAPLWGRYSLEHLTIGDSLGYHNRPGARFEKFRINRFGFRGADIQREKAPGVIRVGIVGASEAFGMYERPDMELSAQLQRILDCAEAGRFEVVNMATIGMTPPRISFLYRNWLVRFAPDIVVFYPTPAQYLANDAPRPESELARMANVARDPSEWPLGLRAPDKSWSALKELLPDALQARLRRRGIDEERAEHPADWVWTAPPADRLRLFRAHVESLVDEVQQSGARIVLARHANRFGGHVDDEDRRQLVSWIKWYPRASETCILQMDAAANAVIDSIGEARRVPVADIAGAVGKDPLNFADFVHFTDAGAEKAADAAARAVLDLAHSDAGVGRRR